MSLRQGVRLRRRCVSGAPRRGGLQYQAELEGANDARTGMPLGIPKGAMCVQRFDDSRNSAIHITYRISLRSSSMPEPRDPLLKVFRINFSLRLIASKILKSLWRVLASRGRRRQGRGPPKQQYW
jgi:hypothetical protein